MFKKVMIRLIMVLLCPLVDLIRRQTKVMMIELKYMDKIRKEKIEFMTLFFC